MTRKIQELTYELKNKKLGDLTVEEFINLFPKMTQRHGFYKREYSDILDGVYNKVCLSSGTITIWDIAKDMEVSYHRVRTAALRLEIMGKIKIEKIKNKDKRETSVLTVVVNL